MSEAAKAARAAMKSKAARLTKADPSQKVDSSTWSPPEALDADVKTGARPLVKRLYKKGGKVIGKAAGEASKARADRTARKSGGRIGKEAEDRSKRYLTPDNLINRDVRMANEAREGKKHVGAFKKGGKAGKLSGGALRSYIDKAGADRDRREGNLGSMGHDLQGKMYDAKQKWNMQKRQRGMDLAEEKLSRKGEGFKKGGKAFPDLTGDGKVTKADVLKGRGVLKHGGKSHKFGGGPIGDNPISDQSRAMGQAAMMKKGGRAKKAEGGDTSDPIGELIRKLPPSKQRNVPAEQRQLPKKKTNIDDYFKRSDLDAERDANAKAFDEQQQQYQRSLPQNQKRGGKVKNWEGSKKDEAQDRLLAKKYGISMEKWEKSAKDKKHDKQQSMEGLKKGGRTAKYSGGGVFSGDSLTKIPGATGGREAHAKGGKAKKGKMSINIMIATGAGHPNADMPNAPVPAPKAMPVPPPMPPQGGAPMGGMPPAGPQGMPPMGGGAFKKGGRVGKFGGGAMAARPIGPVTGGLAMGPRTGGPAVMPPSFGFGPRTAGPAVMPTGTPMARNTGGRTTHVIDHAAGGGLGRMEKIKAYGHKAGKVVGKK